MDFVEFKDTRYSLSIPVDTKDMPHVTDMPILNESSRCQVFSSHHSDFFEIVPFSTDSHPFAIGSASQILQLINCDEPYYPQSTSLPQTPAKLTKCYEISAFQDYSEFDSPQIPPKPTNSRYPSTPQHHFIYTAQTPVKATNRHQAPSIPRPSSAQALPLTPLTTAEPSCSDISRQYVVSGSSQKSPREPTECHSIKLSGTHPISTAPSRSRLQPIKQTCAGLPINRPVSVSPLQTLLQAKASRRSQSRRYRSDKKPAKVSKRHPSTGESQPSGSSRVVKFINLTPDDGMKISAAVAPSGTYATIARCKSCRK